MTAAIPLQATYCGTTLRTLLRAHWEMGTTHDRGPDWMEQTGPFGGRPCLLDPQTVTSIDLSGEWLCMLQKKE